MFSIRKLFAADSPKDRIFISYRRSDTEGYAGRLGGTLKGYFGERRIFRDVGGITAGEDFQQKIERSIEGAAALIVLIGPDWPVTNNDGVPPNQVTMSPEKLRPRLRRIDSSCRGLVNGAKMALEEDLPKELRRVTRRNATTVSDESWIYDVTRLAKVLSFDVAGSLAERRLRWLKLGIFSLLPMAFTLVAFSQAAFHATCLAGTQHTDLYPVLTPGESCGRASFGFKCTLLKLTECKEGTKPTSFTKNSASINPLVICVTLLTLLATISWIDPS